MAAGLLAFAPAPHARADWVPLEDFNFVPGLFIPGDGNDWVDAGGNPGESRIDSSGSGPTYNEYLCVDGGDSNDTNLAFYLSLGAHPIDGGCGTLFLRMRIPTADPLLAYGVIGLTRYADADFEHYAAMLNDENGYFRVYDSGFKAVDDQPGNDTWYNYWVVANDASDVYQVYRTTGDAGATAADRLTHSSGTDSNFAFRATGAGGDPLSFVRIMHLYNQGPCHFDQIAIDNTGTNLTMPSFGAEAEPFVFYSESFTNAVANELPVSNNGWKGYAISNGTVVLDFTDDTTGGLPNDGGNFNDILAVGRVGTSPGAVSGYGYLFYAPKNENPDNMTGPAFAHTADGEVSGGTAVRSITKVNFWIKNVEDTAMTRFAMKIDNQWYVETTGHVEFEDTWGPVTLENFSGLSWTELNFDPESNILSLGDLVAGSLSGTADAFGFYMVPGAVGGNVRVDELHVLCGPFPTASLIVIK